MDAKRWKILSILGEQDWAKTTPTRYRRPRKKEKIAQKIRLIKLAIPLYWLSEHFQIHWSLFLSCKSDKLIQSEIWSIAIWTCVRVARTSFLSHELNKQRQKAPTCIKISQHERNCRRLSAKQKQKKNDCTDQVHLKVKNPVYRKRYNSLLNSLVAF